MNRRGYGIMVSRDQPFMGCVGEWNDNAHGNYSAALQATPNQNIEAASSVQQKDKMADGSGFSSPSPALLPNF